MYLTNSEFFHTKHVSRDKASQPASPLLIRIQTQTVSPELSIYTVCCPVFVRAQFSYEKKNDYFRRSFKSLSTEEFRK